MDEELAAGWEPDDDMGASFVEEEEEEEEGEEEAAPAPMPGSVAEKMAGKKSLKTDATLGNKKKGAV